MPPAPGDAVAYSARPAPAGRPARGDELATATLEAIQSIAAVLVERVETRGRLVVIWVPTVPAEPFFDSALLSPWRPRTDSNRQYQRSALDRYLEVS